MRARTVTDAERRWRLARRHGFADPPEDASQLAAAIAGLHSSDPVTVYLAAAARRAAATPKDVDRVMYDDRSALRLLGMRRTLFVEPLELATAVQRGFSDDLLVKERRRAAGWFEDAGLTEDGQAYIDRLFECALEHLAEVGEAATRDITPLVPGFGDKYLPRGSPKWATPQSVGSRIILLMAAAGLIVRTRPLGTWISSQYRYAVTDRWLGAPLAEMDRREGQAAVVSAWLRGFGPATLTDVKWWTGLTVTETRAALQRIGAVEVSLEDGETGLLLPDDIDPVDHVEPWAALLPGLDPTPMGWKERDWYLGGHADVLFDRNGNCGPTVWWDGAVVGGWAQRPDGEIVLRYLSDPGAQGRRAVEDEMTRLADFLGDTRFTPRFRTPLETTLADS